MRSQLVENSDFREIRKSRLSWKPRNSIDKSKMIRPVDEGNERDKLDSYSLFLFDFLVIFKVYCADHTYTTMKMRIDTSASKIIRVSADKLGLRSDQPNDLKLCEVKSTGGEHREYRRANQPARYSLVCRRTYSIQRERFECLLWLIVEWSIILIAEWTSRCSGKQTMLSLGVLALGSHSCSTHEWVMCRTWVRV